MFKKEMEVSGFKYRSVDGGCVFGENEFFVWLWDMWMNERWYKERRVLLWRFEIFVFELVGSGF